MTYSACQYKFSESDVGRIIEVLYYHCYYKKTIIIVG